MVEESNNEITAGCQMDLAARSPIQVPLIHALVRVESILWTDEVYNDNSYVTPEPEKTLQGKQRWGRGVALCGPEGSSRHVGAPASFREDPKGSFTNALEALLRIRTRRNHALLDLQGCLAANPISETD